MTVRQLQRQKNFMGKFTNVYPAFTKLRPVTLTCSVAFLIFMEFFMMKKTAIALGIAAMAFGAQAADWMVAPDHKLEVNADVGAYYQTTKSSTGLASSTILGAGINQIQLKSTKTLANGVKIIGQVELDYDPLQDNYPAWTDDTKVGVDIPVYGRFLAGQWDTFFEDNVAEALGFWGIGDIAAYVDEPLSTFDSKHLQYFNTYGDFTLALDATYGYSDTTLTTPMVGLATTVGYKLGDLQIYVGSATAPSYYANANGSKTGSGYGTSTHTNSSGVSAFYTMGNTKVAGLVHQVQLLNGAIYNYGGVSVQQTIDAWKLGFAFQNANLGSTNQYSQYAVGANYSLAKDAVIFLEANSLGKSNGSGDTVEFGMKYTF